MEKVESITGSCKFALRSALECDFETTRVSAIYINTPLDTFYSSLYSSMASALDEGENYFLSLCFAFCWLSSLFFCASRVLLAGLSSSFQQAQGVICNYMFFCTSLPIATTYASMSIIVDCH
jgi:hypothetical protein